MDKINLKAPAKINLFLRVLDKRPDGYHNIESLMQTISLYDELTMEKSDDIELECGGMDAIPDEQNLAYKAAKLVESMTYFPGVKITLKKAIPSGAGLGGGSSDAAFVIRGLIKLYDLKLEKSELVEKSSRLGADIPFFLTRGQARITGIGDQIEDCKLPLKYRILVVKPPFSVSTAETYGALDEVRKRKFSLTNDSQLGYLYRSIADPNFVRLTSRFINDLEEVVFSRHQELLRIKQNLCKDGAFYSSMTGSGSAVFGLFSPDNSIEQTARRYSGNNLVFICQPVLLPPAA